MKKPRDPPRVQGDLYGRILRPYCFGSRRASREMPYGCRTCAHRYACRSQR